MPFRRAPNCATGPLGGKPNSDYTALVRAGPSRAGVTAGSGVRLHVEPVHGPALDGCRAVLAAGQQKKLFELDPLSGLRQPHDVVRRASPAWVIDRHQLDDAVFV